MARSEPRAARWPKRKLIRAFVGVVAFVSLLAGGGFVVAVYSLFDTAEDSIPALNPERQGGPDNPLPVSAGESFTIDDMRFAGDWRVAPSNDGGVKIIGLRVSNEAAAKTADQALIDVRFIDGSEVVAELSCSTDTLESGQSTTATCTSADVTPGDFTELTVSAAL